jgi:C4-dicarboxylate-specific signal transduction histidine kinase
MKQVGEKNTQVAFLGKMTASMTHELKNVLAIIRESSGLMQDILTFSNDGTGSYEDKLKEILQTIDDQVTRGVEITSRMNRVAHDPDEAMTSVELNDLVAHLVALSTRFAQMKKIDLVFAPSETSIVVRTNPLLLQMALFAAIECCFSAMPSGGRMDIHVETEKEEKQVVISLDGTDPSARAFSEILTENREWIVFSERVEDLGGRYALDAPLRRLSVFLPEGMPGEHDNRQFSGD